MAKKITRAVVIGIGGTGQKVILGIKKKFYERYDVLPESIQYISIDTDKRTEAIDDFKYNYGLAEKKTKVAINSEDFLYIKSGNLRNSFENNQNVREFAPESLPKIATGLIEGVGANGIRIVGRLISYLNKDKIRTRINEKINYLETSVNDISARLQTLGFEQIDTADNQDILVFLAGSWSGGTGSGILWDILGTLGKLKEKGTRMQTFGFFFMPDFYTDYPNTDNANANAYGTFLELDHLCDPHVREDDELNFEVGDYLYKHSPLNSINLIQKDSGRVKLKSASEAYDAVATAIASLSTSIGQKAISSICNDLQATLYTMGGKRRNYSSIGISEISLQRNRILNYGIGKLLIPQLEKYLICNDLDPIRNLAYQFITDNRLDEGEDEDSAQSKNDLIDSLIQPDTANDLAEFQEIELRGEITQVMEDACSSYISDLTKNIDARLSSYQTETVKQKIRDKLNSILLNNSGGIPQAKAFAESLKASFKLMTDLLRDEVKHHIKKRDGLEEEVAEFMGGIDGMKVGMLNRKKVKNIVNEIITIFGETGQESVRWQIVEKKRKEKAIEIFVALIELLEMELSHIEMLEKAVNTSIGTVDADNKNFQPKLSEGRVIRLGYFLKAMIDDDPYLIIKSQSGNKVPIPTLDLNIANIFVNEAQLEGVHTRLLDILKETIGSIANEDSLANSLLDVDCPIDKIINTFITKVQQNEMWIALNNIFEVFWNHHGMDTPCDAKPGARPESKSTEHIFIIGTHEGNEETSYINRKNLSKLTLTDDINTANLVIAATNNPNSITLFVHESSIPAKNLSAVKNYKTEFENGIGSESRYYFTDKRFEGKVADLFESRGGSMDEIREAWVKGCVLGKIYNEAKSYYIEFSGKTNLHNTGQARKRNDRIKTFEFFAGNKDYIAEMNFLFENEIKENKNKIPEILIDYLNNSMYTIKNIGKQKPALNDAESELIKNEKMIVLRLGIYSFSMRKEDFYDENEKNKSEVDSLVRAIERMN